MATKPPCYGCSERHPVCHDHCQPYLDWKAERDAIREAHREWKQSLSIKGHKYAYPYDPRHP